MVVIINNNHQISALPFTTRHYPADDNVILACQAL
jgi:hypothetical protein